MIDTKISIIVPCYNQAQYLEECLQSVLNQTFQDWECIIVNDGSLDNTDEIAPEWLKKDNRFRYLHKENVGLSSARNNGIAIATGTYILPLDADDTIEESYIEKIVYEFENKKSLHIVYTKARQFGAVNKEWYLPDYNFKNLLISNMIYCSAVFRKSDWEKIGGYDENLIYGLEDWEFWIRILKETGKVKCIDYCGFNYRIKNESMITNLPGKKNEATRNYIFIKHARTYGKIFGDFSFVKNVIKGKKYYLHNKKFILDIFLATYFGVTVFKSSKKV